MPKPQDDFIKPVVYNDPTGQPTTDRWKFLDKVENFAKKVFRLNKDDADKIKGNEIHVRLAKQGEKFVTLDGVEREMNERDLMIANSSEAMCIAGVFGGLESGVTENTKNVFLESAYFFLPVP